MYRRADYHCLTDSPDGFVEGQHERAPAWFGSRWKMTFLQEDMQQVAGETAPVEGDDPHQQVQAGDPSENVEVDPPQQRLCGPRMKYDHCLASLEPFECYAPADVPKFCYEHRLFSRADDARLKRELRKVGDAARAFANKHLPSDCDETRTLANGTEQRAWYGWRWLMALPDYAFSPAEKSSVGREVARHQAAKLKKSAKARFISHRAMVFGLSIVFLVGAGTMIVNHRMGEFIHLLQTQGVRSAYDFAVSGEDDFSRAWADFRVGDFEGAQKIAAGLAASRHEETAANAHYLLGNLAIYQGRPGQAQTHLTKALSFYQKGGFEENAQLANLALARIMVDAAIGEPEKASSQAVLDHAEAYLRRAAATREPPALYFELLARIEFERGDFRKALAISEDALARFGDDAGRRGQLLSGIGFFMMLCGDLEQGFIKTKEAELLLMETGDKPAYFYNLVNEYYYRRCLGLPSEHFLARINSRPQLAADPALIKAIAFARYHSDLVRANLVSDGRPLGSGKSVSQTTHSLSSPAR